MAEQFSNAPAPSREEFEDLAEQIAIKATNASGISIIYLRRAGNFVQCACNSGKVNTNASANITNGTTDIIIPTGYRPAINTEFKDTNENYRMVAETGGNLYVPTKASQSDLALRFSVCWITSDALPS